MKVDKCTDIFNLMDTNGRRSDVINALQGYLRILDEILNTRHLKWKHMPESTAQFHFYEQAYAFSKGVFRRNQNYDYVKERLEELPDLKAAIYAEDNVWISQHKNEYKELFKKIDNGIEDRARHYTSNLVKLGFTDSNRNISRAGEALLGKIQVVKDKYERILPINETNILYLRQLMKLRIYTKDAKAFYSPFCMGIFILLKKGKVSQAEFMEIIQSQTPYKLIKDLDFYVENYYEGQYLEEFEVTVPDEIAVDRELEESVFRKHFSNGKTASSVDKYYAFYQLLYTFNESRKQQDLDKLVEFCENNREVLNKAFGYGKNIFSARKGEKISVEEFVQSEIYDLFSNVTDSFPETINEKLYCRFIKSKRADDLREKSDTTRRIFKATGIISFDNGYVTLAYKELCEHIFDIVKMKEKSMGLLEQERSVYYHCYDEYEGNTDTFFCNVQSLTSILECTEEGIEATLEKVRREFGESDIREISLQMRENRRKEFENFIEKMYPESRVKQILSLFSDRKNDRKIRNEVNPDATVPTIYEYIVGLAWYYFSNKSINILESYHLTLSADFEPITHAGGGTGDIVIKEKDKVIMLEVTLMNPNNQKRGEWEPVLRHSVNLKVEEEAAKTGREVTTFFIADEFDYNTINIWKAISSVPMQSSADKDKFTNNVIIMPINNSELTTLIEKKSEYNEIIKRVRELFIADETTFDMGWRSRFISEVL